ncbi:MAG: hypothetical protein D6740_01700 [Alphaproteobacteria bacterium]|nr:MAG: hypothetical protein D6740_01700 [Alphaproteobacteria bacterium]
MRLAWLLAAVLLSSGLGMSAGRAGEDYLDDRYVRVVVIFSHGLAEHVEAIDRSERRMERKLRSWGSYAGLASIHNRGRLAGSGRLARWAGKRLIPDLDRYSLKNLIAAMTRYEIARAFPQFRGYVRFVIEEMKIARHPVAYLRGSASYIRGSVEVVDYGGHTLGRFSGVSTRQGLEYTVDPTYDGPGLLFPEEDLATRVGPTLALFVTRVMKRIWPHRADRFAGPVLYRTGHGLTARFN